MHGIHSPVRSPASPADGELFDAEYYRRSCGPIPYERNEKWLAFFSNIADNIVRSLKPRRVLDAGCALGFLVEALWDRGIEAWGIDISPYAISNVRRDMQPYCRVASLIEALPDRFDLITCIEVLEHMRPAETRVAMENLTTATDLILFSSTPKDLAEPTHFNVRPSITWLKLFAEFGFWPDALFDASFIAPHAMLLRRGPRELPEEVLVLFSEMLRYKCGMVERDGRIGELTRLQSNHESERAAAQRELAETCNRFALLSDRNASLLEQNHKLQGEYEIVRQKLTETSNQLTQVNRQSAILLYQNKRLESERDRIRQELVETSTQLAQFDQQNATLVDENKRLEQELAGMRGSAAWQFIERYRRWLQRSFATRPGLRTHYEKVAGWVLRRLALRPAELYPTGESLAVPVKHQPLSASGATGHFGAKADSKFVLMMSGCPGDAFRYRCEHQAEELRLAGLTVDTDLYENVDYEHALFRYEAFVLHRVPHTPEIESLIVRAKTMGKPVIFDTDDLVFNEQIAGDIKALKLLPPHEVQWYLEGLRRYNRTLSLCSAAIVATDTLRAELNHLFPDMPVYVNRNAVSDSMIEQADFALSQVEKPSDYSVRVAYLSGTRTHNEDFAQCATALTRLLRKYPNVHLMLVGHLDVPDCFEGFFGQIEKVPLVPWHELPLLIRTVDINLAPLEMDNRFTACKSELKYLEAALLEVPTVASDVPPFRGVITSGQNGFLCKTEEEWFQALERLVVDPQLRTDFGARARNDALRSYTTRSRSPELTDVFTRIFDAGRNTAGELSVAFVMRAPIAQTGGGYKNIFALGNWLAERGHDVHFYVEEIAHLTGFTEAQIVDFCHFYFGESPARIHVGHQAIARSDIAIATNWPTAYTVDRLTNTTCKLYLVQDFEPEFYDRSDPQYQQAEQTYDLRLKKVALGKYLAALFSQRDRIPVPYIQFSLDRSTYRSVNVRPNDGPVRILFFARPGIKRRAYPVGVAALERIARSCPGVEIAFYGMAEPQELGFRYINLGELSQRDVAREMNNSHIHLSFSLTNVSWVGLEAMACGCAVVEADVPSLQGMLGPSGETCLLVTPQPDSVASALIRLVNDSDLRGRIAANGEQFVSSVTSTWEESCAQFEEILQGSVFNKSREVGGSS